MDGLFCFFHRGDSRVAATYGYLLGFGLVQGVRLWRLITLCRLEGNITVFGGRGDALHVIGLLSFSAEQGGPL